MDWLTDPKVMMLSDTAYRAYHMLLNHQWISGPLPTDDQTLGKLSGVGRRWKGVKDDVLQFFEHHTDSIS